MKTIIMSIMSRGALGKSTVAELLACWLIVNKIDWSGSSLDDRHNEFLEKFPDQVKSYLLTYGVGASNQVAGVFNAAVSAPEPVHLIDTRAQADAILLEGIRKMHVLTKLKKEQTRLVVFIIPSNDEVHMANLKQVVSALRNQVSWLIVNNPTKHELVVWQGTQFQKTLLGLGAREITLPGYTDFTRSEMVRAERKQATRLSFLEAAAESSDLDVMAQGDLQEFLAESYAQFDSVADLLLPPEQAAAIKDLVSKKKEDELPPLRFD